MLEQMSFRSERHGAGLAAERALEVMDVDVQFQLTGLREDLVAHDAYAPTVFRDPVNIRPG